MDVGRDAPGDGHSKRDTPVDSRSVTPKRPLITHTLGVIARARGMSQIARKTGLGRESLYKALSPDGNPEFSTVLKVVRALGLRLHASAA
jgi:probable addiction module antidote protein